MRVNGNREQALRDLEAWLERHADEAGSEADVSRLVDAFLASRRTDAGEDGLARIEADCAGNPDALRVRLREAVARAEAALPPERGEDLWLSRETRPYMRLRHRLFECLIECGQYRAAAREGEALLALGESDVPGARYRLMHVYACLEEEAPMEELHRRSDGYEETGMLLPLSVVCYKREETERALAYLLRLRAVNPGTDAFLRMAAEADRDGLPRPDGRPRPFTLEELLAEYAENRFLFDGVPGFFAWALRALPEAADAGKDARPN